MAVGTSQGHLFDDEMAFHRYHNGMSDDNIINPNSRGKEGLTQDKNIVSPNQMRENQEEQKFDLSIDNPDSGIDIGLKPDVEDRRNESTFNMVKDYIGSQLTSEKVGAILRHPLSSVQQTLTADQSVRETPLGNDLGLQDLKNMSGKQDPMEREPGY